MIFRSTNARYTHFGGDVVSNVDDSSHGVKLSGGSTGGVVESVGDEANVALRVTGKGTGAVILGNSSSPLTIASTTFTLASTAFSMSTGSVFQLGSTAPFAGHIRATDTAVATPDFNTTNAMVMQTSVTITGVNSSHFVIANVLNSAGASTDMVLSNVRPTSTNNEVLMYWTKVSTLTVAASTVTVRFLAFRF